MSRARVYGRLILLLFLRCILMPARTFNILSYLILDFIASRTDFVLTHSCMYLLGVLLSYEMSSCVFFISENKLMRWNTRRIRIFGESYVLPIRLGSEWLCLNPVLALVILTRPRRSHFILGNLLETVDFRGKSVRRFDNSDSKLFKTDLLERLSSLQVLLYIIETRSWVITTRAFIFEL
jgi:hypothetical protein